MPCATVCATRLASISRSGRRSARPWASPSSANTRPSDAAAERCFAAAFGRWVRHRRPTPAAAASRPMTPTICSPSARAANVSAMRCLQHRLGQRHHVVDRGGEAAVEQRLGAHREHQRLAGARARAPGDQPVGLGACAGAGTRRAHQLQDRLDDLVGHRDLAHQPLDRHQLVRAGRSASSLRSSVPVVANSMRRSAPRSG